MVWSIQVQHVSTCHIMTTIPQQLEYFPGVDAVSVQNHWVQLIVKPSILNGLTDVHAPV